MCVVRLGGEDAEFLSIHLLGRSHPGCTDYWDGNWLCAKVEVATGGFRGAVTSDLRAEELVQLRQQMSRLHDSLRGTAEFATMEQWLSFRAVGDRRGHVMIEGELRDHPTGNALTFRFEHDQTFVRSMLGQLGEALRQFPVMGTWR